MEEIRGGRLMPISGNRVLGLQRRKDLTIQGFHKTVHLEYIVVVPGASDYRPGTQSTGFSIPLEPRPVVRQLSEEDIQELGASVSLGDYIFEFPGDMVTNDQLLLATQLTLNKGMPDEEDMKIVTVKPTIWQDRFPVKGELAIVGGKVMRWKIAARATKLAA